MDVLWAERRAREDEGDVEAGQGEGEDGVRNGKEEGALEGLAGPRPHRSVQVRVGREAVGADCGSTSGQQVPFARV